MSDNESPLKKETNRRNRTKAKVEEEVEEKEEETLTEIQEKSTDRKKEQKREILYVENDYFEGGETESSTEEDVRSTMSSMRGRGSNGEKKKKRRKKTLRIETNNKKTKEEEEEEKKKEGKEETPDAIEGVAIKTNTPTSSIGDANAVLFNTFITAKQEAAQAEGKIISKDSLLEEYDLELKKKEFKNLQKYHFGCWLYKKGEVATDWKRRYFVVSSKNLEYGARPSKLQKTITRATIEFIHDIEFKNGPKPLYGISIKAKGFRTLQLQAENKFERDTLIMVLKNPTKENWDHIEEAEKKLTKAIYSGFRKSINVSKIRKGIKTYYNAFNGFVCVDLIKELTFINTRFEANIIANAMLEQGLILPVSASQKQVFDDVLSFYKLPKENTVTVRDSVKPKSGELKSMLERSGSIKTMTVNDEESTPLFTVHIQQVIECMGVLRGDVQRIDGILKRPVSEAKENTPLRMEELWIKIEAIFEFIVLSCERIQERIARYRMKMKEEEEREEQERLENIIRVIDKSELELKAQRREKFNTELNLMSQIQPQLSYFKRKLKKARRSIDKYKEKLENHNNEGAKQKKKSSFIPSGYEFSSDEDEELDMADSMSVASSIMTSSSNASSTGTPSSFTPISIHSPRQFKFTPQTPNTPVKPVVTPDNYNRTQKSRFSRAVMVSKNSQKTVELMKSIEKERIKKLEHLNDGVDTILELSKEINGLLHEQQPDLDKISASVANTNAQVMASRQNIRSALGKKRESKLQSKYNSIAKKAKFISYI